MPNTSFEIAPEFLTWFCLQRFIPSRFALNHFVQWEVDHDLTWFPTGRQLARTVTYILRGGEFGLTDGYCIMSIQ